MKIGINKGDVLKLLPLMIIVNILLIASYVIINSKTNLISLDDLMIVLPGVLLVTLFAFFALFIKNIKTIGLQFSNIERKTWVWLLIIMLIGLYFRAFVVPHTHRIFFDEDIYLDIGNSIATEGRALLCNDGTPTKCNDGILNKEPNGYPVLIAILYFIFGSSESIIFGFSVFVGTLSILLVFLISYLVFDERNGVYCALLFALMPAHIIWSGSVGAEIYSLTFTLITILSFMLYFKTQKFELHMMSIFALAYAIQMRPENGLLIAIVGMMFVVFDKKIVKRLEEKRFLASVILLFLLIIPHMVHITHAAATDTWGAEHGKLGLKYLNQNFQFNTDFWYDGEMHPALFSVFTLVGVIALLKSRNISILFLIGLLVFFIGYYYFYEQPIQQKRALGEGRGLNSTILFFLPLTMAFLYSASKRSPLSVFLLWFMILQFLFLVFYSGSFTSGGIGTRFAQIIGTPLFFIGGYGLAAVENLFKKKHRSIVAIALFMIILLSVKPFIGFIKTPDHQAQYAREMHDWVVSKIPETDESCYFLTHNPSIFLINGRSTLQTWNGQNTKRMKEISEETDCIMFLEGAWCLFEPHKSGVCEHMHKAYDLKVRWRLTREENQEQVFTLYEVNYK